MANTFVSHAQQNCAHPNLISTNNGIASVEFSSGMAQFSECLSKGSGNVKAEVDVAVEKVTRRLANEAFFIHGAAIREL